MSNAIKAANVPMMCELSLLVRRSGTFGGDTETVADSKAPIVEAGGDNYELVAESKHTLVESETTDGS